MPCELARPWSISTDSSKRGGELMSAPAASASPSPDNGATEPKTLDEALMCIQQLKDALATRGQIGRAQGILMERFGLDADTAFDLLKSLSTNNNRKLREIADLIVTRAAVEGLPSLTSHP